MASIYFRKDSRYVWIQGKEAGKKTAKATRYDKSNPHQVRLARALAAEMTAKELRHGVGRKREGWAWASLFIETTYGGGNPITYRNYKQSWATVQIFLSSHDLREPSHLMRRHCGEYIAWRKAGAPGVRPAKQSTALTELTLLRIVMNEAVERELVTGNPCAGLKIRREKRKRKPKLTDEQCRIIRREIQKEGDKWIKEMLFYSFEICRFQGCRLMSSRINPQTDVELFTVRKADGQIEKRGSVRIWNKGEELNTILHPALIPMFERLKYEGRTYTWRIRPKRGYSWAAGTWWQFLKRIGLKDAGVTPHCNRVTVASELLSVHSSKGRSILGHKSESIHADYVRVDLEDLVDAMALVGSSLYQDANSDEQKATSLPHPHQTDESSAHNQPPT